MSTKLTDLAKEKLRFDTENSLFAKELIVTIENIRCDGDRPSVEISFKLINEEDKSILIISDPSLIELTEGSTATLLDLERMLKVIIA